MEALLTKTMLLLRLDANGRVLEASPSDLVPVGTLLSDAVLPGDRAAVEAMLQAARRGEPAWGAVTLQRDSTLQRCDAACIPGEFGTSSWLLRLRADDALPSFEDEEELERWLGRFLIHEIEIGLLVFDHTALLRYRNAPAVRLLASRESELPLGTPWSVVVERLLDYFPSARAVIDALHASVAEGRALHQLELERRDGAVLSLDYLPVHVGQATVAHVLRMRDITVRRRAERRAALAEQRYRDLVELVPVVVYRATAADTVETSYVSPQIERLLGYTPEEWLAERGMWRRHLHPEDRPWITAAIERAVREGKEFSLEYRMVRRDGSIVWVQDWGRVRTDESGCTFIHGVMLDITERKEAERARAEVEARLRALVETMPAVLYVREPEPIRLPDGLLSYPFRYLNDEVAELTGYPASQFLADPTLFARLIHPDDWGRYEAEMLRTDETGQLCDVDYRIVRCDGSVRWIRERAVQLRDATGQPLAWQGLLIDVTAQKETERALRDAEERYRTLVEQLPGALLVVSAQPRWRADGTPAFDLIYVSPQIERLTGYPPAAWHEPGLWMRLVHPDDRPHVLSCLERCLRERAARTVEYRLVRADGRTVWIRHEATLLLDQDGEPLAWQSLLLDITAEKEAEAAQRESEERFRLLAEHHPGAVTIVEPEPVALSDGTLGWRTLFVSPRIVDLTGYTAEEWSELGVWMRNIHPEDRERVLAEAERWYRVGPQQPLEYRFRHKDGRWVWLRQEGALVRDQGGRPRYLLLVTIDVTEQRQLLEQLREAELRYRTLVEQLPSVVLIRPLVPDREAFQRGMLNIYVSPAIERLTGFRPEEWTTERFLAQLHPDDRERVLAAITTADRTGESLDLEYRLLHKDGSVVWVWSISHVVRAADGIPPYRQVLLTDITARKRAEEALRGAEERYRTLVEQLPGAVILRSPESRRLPDGSLTYEILYISPNIERLTEFTASEWQEPGRWSRQIHPADRERVLAAQAESERTGSPLDIEYRFIRKDGRTIWLWHITRILRDANGTPRLRQVLLLDVTRRKESELALQEAEARYRSLVEQLPGAVLIRSASSELREDGSRQFDIHYVSPGIERLTGFTSQEWLVPGTWTRQIHPDDRDRVFAAVLASEAAAEPLELEYRLYRKDGTLIWIWHQTKVIHDQDGKPLYRQVLLTDITARKQAEEALRAAEAHYRTLVEQLPAVVIRVTARAQRLPDGLPGYETTYVSPQIEAVTGYTPEEWKELGIWARRLHPEDRERVLDAFWQHEATGEPLQLEYRFLHKDGRTVWLWHELRPIRAPDGTIQARQAVLMDITERKRAEQALREAEERYRTLVEQLPAVVYLEGAQPVRYPDGRLARPLLYVSPQVEQLTGYRPEEHQQDRTLWVQAIHPEDYPRVRQETREAWATGRFRSEFRILRRDGEVRWIESTARLVRDDQGKPLYWQGVMLDVTERKQAEEALREAEERYRTLVEQIPAAVLVTSAEPVVLPDGSLHYPVTFLSQRIEEVTGFSREEFLATPGLWFSRMHPDDQPRVFAEAVRTDETGEPFEATYRFQRKDGRWVWLENRAVMVRNAEGKPLFWHGLLIDVTERKRAEALLFAQTTLLRLIAEAAPLSEILELLCRLVEQQAPGLRCSVLLLGSDDRLYHGAAPSLPPRYLAAIDGLPIGPQAGSCGTAAYLDRPIFVEDIASDPRWADYREAALEAGLRACWSTPIRGTSGNVLGTVALYASEPRGPQPNEERLLELATQLAALALERWQESEELRHRAFHDPLTGLPNRLLFLDRLEHAVARADRDGGGIAVLFLDLDDFKRVNDTWGHAVGDVVLQEAAARLSRQVRAGDTVARFAGDEFTVLLDGVTGEHDVRVVTERLLAALASPIRCGEQEIRMGLSIGAAVATGRPMPDSGALLLSADQALYAAKRRGKGCYEIVIAQPGSSQAERRSS
ncbi:PAS domain-containing protein [Thermomicrobium roseum]|uniref:histidine kinase n=1 Tax=Thermomicrobium roseum (strain ATCC 27502 / DSM 5159 / P-2) TaxID=309801 RepID=B9L266_THERP|nr:PAS domain-containing protein [Thermomicrobium roseum]ACM05661.1 PAS domain S-box protein [Thermomicrobium roseum DSM 5159]